MEKLNAITQIRISPPPKAIMATETAIENVKKFDWTIRSMAYLKHELEHARDEIRYYERGSYMEESQAKAMYACEQAMAEEVCRRIELGIVDPEGFCDFKDNEYAHWDWECECETCQKQIEEYNKAADEWENQCGDYPEPEMGNCGERCGASCDYCDPGYLDRMKYGTYDAAGEI